MYMVLTEMIAKEIEKQRRMNNIIEDNQRGCKKGAKGCKDQLMLDRCITEDASENEKNLSVAQIDYQKAYNSIPIIISGSLKYYAQIMYLKNSSMVFIS